jgi:hypothetical protein
MKNDLLCKTPALCALVGPNVTAGLHRTDKETKQRREYNEQV